MSKTLILYTSKYGATKKYVDWMQEIITCDVVNLKEKQPSDVRNYDCIILAGGIYASGVAGMKYLKKIIPDVKEKKVAILSVGASPYDEQAIEHLKQHNMKDIPVEIPIFYARGMYNEASMSFKDRTLCKMLKKMVAKKDASTMEPWEKALMQAIHTNHDWTCKENLDLILAYVK